MNLEHYEFEQLGEFDYRFFSNGSKGTFEMHVRFTSTGANSCNLGFGAVDPTSGWLDDLIELRNGDSQKILATVANISCLFMEVHPSIRIYAAGSTASRTRLYQMGINRILPQLTDYKIAGLLVEPDRQGGIWGSYPKWKGEWQEFRKGISYDAFLIFKR